MKIFQLRNKIAVAGDVGIELEVEGENLPYHHIQGREPRGIGGSWSIVSDGSLRNGAEYILTKPVKASQVSKALKEMETLFKDADTKPHYSFRTSSHIHINVNELEYEQVLNMIYTYALLENVITKVCGKNRIGNRFCLRIADAEGTLRNVQKLIQRRARGGYNFTSVLDEGSTKYAGINVYVLRKYGSLEFRTMEGTNDWDRLQKWIDTLLAIREFSQKMKDIPAIWEELNKVGAKDFLTQVLGALAEDYWDRDSEAQIVVQASVTYDLVLEALRNPAGEAPAAIAKEAFDPWRIDPAQFVAPAAPRAGRIGIRRGYPVAGGYIWDRAQDVSEIFRGVVAPIVYKGEQVFYMTEANFQKVQQQH